MRRHLVQLLAAGVMTLCIAPARADLGDQLFKLLPSDGAAGDRFGISVVISGDIAIVGAYFDNDNGTDSGAVYLFDTTSGQQTAKLLASDGSEGDAFGISVAISGTTVIVGAWYDGDNGNDSGSAYLFDITTGHQIAKLLPADGAAEDMFGLSVAISGTTAIVGAYGDDDDGDLSGSAYLFDTTTGEQIAKLLPSDGGVEHLFGHAVAMSGNIAIVGAPWDDDNGGFSGSAYIFDVTTGEQIAKLLPHDGALGDSFGVSVGVSGSTAIIGSYLDDNSGSAYIFDTTTGRQTAKLVADDRGESDLFGWTTAINGTTAIVGAQHDDDRGQNSGSAYLFDTITGRQVAKLIADDTARNDIFGYSVSISGNTAIVGALSDDDNGEFSGSAYLFGADSSPGTPAALTGINIETGVLLDGDLPDLISSNDSYVHTRSGLGESLTDFHHTEMIVDAHTDVVTPTTLDVTIESRIDEPVGTAQIRLHNWKTGAFTHIGQYAIGVNDESLIARKIDAAEFVNGTGEIQLSIKQIVFAPFRAFRFESWFDFVKIIVR